MIQILLKKGVGFPYSTWGWNIDKVICFIRVFSKGHLVVVTQNDFSLVSMKCAIFFSSAHSLNMANCSLVLLIFFYTNNRWFHVGIEENCNYLLIFIFSNRDTIQFFRQKWNHGVQNWITEFFVWRNEMFNSFLVLGFKILLCGELCNGKLISRGLCMYLIH